MKTSPIVVLTVQVIVALVAAFLSTIVGFIVGAFIGGNFGFFEFKGLVGYESAGLIFSVLFAAAGAWLSAWGVAWGFKSPVHKLLGAAGALAAAVLVFIIIPARPSPEGSPLFLFIAQLFIFAILPIAGMALGTKR